MAHEINISTVDLAGACTLASNLHRQGYDVAVYSDKDGFYYIMDEEAAALSTIAPSDHLLLLEYDPSKGIPVSTSTYRGPERRRTPRIPWRVPMLVTKLGKLTAVLLLCVMPMLTTACVWQVGPTAAKIKAGRECANYRRHSPEYERCIDEVMEMPDGIFVKGF